jgi:hypothetical protein
VSIETFLILPTRDPKRARAWFGPEHEETLQIGTDCVAVYYMERFDEVEASPEEHGPAFAASLPPWLRKGLDPRGIAAVPEVAQSYAGADYVELVQSDDALLWLPFKKARVKGRAVRSLLVGLSAARQKALIDEPTLVADLVAMHVATPIAGAAEFEHWVELQRVLFEAMLLTSGSDEDPRSDAVAPRRGLPLYEDKTVDAAKLVRATEVAVIAEWLSSLPSDTIESVRARPRRSRRAMSFPANLGAAPADDDMRIRRTNARIDASGELVRARLACPLERSNAALMKFDLVRLTAFYSELRAKGMALLAIHHRALNPTKG